MNSDGLLADVARSDAILFDLFHTLTSMVSASAVGPSTSEMLGVDRAAWTEQLLEHSRERLVGEMTDPLATIRMMARAIDPTISDDVIAATCANRIRRFAATVVDIPAETCSVLDRLRAGGKKLALISNADVSEVAAWDRSPLAERFDAAVFSCHAGCVKPEPEIYRLAMRELGVEPGQCLFVGDGGSDELRGAKDLGIATVMMTGVIRDLWPHRIDPRRLDADHVIDDLRELVCDDA